MGISVGIGTKIYNQSTSNIHDGASIGRYCTIHSHVWIGERVLIGDDVKIQAFSFIPNGVTIENRVFIGPGVIFTNDRQPPSGGKCWAPILVKEGASIGANATILPGLIIGAGSMVAAGAVVTQDVPPGCLVAGVPARVIKRPGDPEQIKGAPFDEQL